MKYTLNFSLLITHLHGIRDNIYFASPFSIRLIPHRLATLCSVIAIALLLNGSLCNAQSEVVTNTTIVAMVRAGFGEEVIIEKIKTSHCAFNVSVDSMLWLKNNKVSEPILTAMMNAKSDSKKMGSSDNPTEAHQSGIYYYDANGETGKKLLPIDANKVSQQKTATIYLYGVPVSNSHIAIDGDHARLGITDTLPVFYFYFQDESAASLNTSGQADFKATSPNEFSIIVFQVNSHAHEREVQTSSSFGQIGSGGISGKYKFQFDYEKVGEGIYKVYSKQAMPKGEYAFMYSVGVPQNRRLYDFGLVTELKKKSRRN